MEEVVGGLGTGCKGDTDYLGMLKLKSESSLAPAFTHSSTSGLR